MGSMGIISFLVFVNVVHASVSFQLIDFDRINSDFIEMANLYTTMTINHQFYEAIILELKRSYTALLIVSSHEPFLVTLCCTNSNNRCFIFCCCFLCCFTASFIASEWDRYLWFRFDPRNIYSKTIVWQWCLYYCAHFPNLKYKQFEILEGINFPVQFASTMTTTASTKWSYDKKRIEVLRNA